MNYATVTMPPSGFLLWLRDQLIAAGWQLIEYVNPITPSSAYPAKERLLIRIPGFSGIPSPCLCFEYIENTRFTPTQAAIRFSVVTVPLVNEPLLRQRYPGYPVNVTSFGTVWVNPLPLFGSSGETGIKLCVFSTLTTTATFFLSYSKLGLTCSYLTGGKYFNFIAEIPVAYTFPTLDVSPCLCGGTAVDSSNVTSDNSSTYQQNSLPSVGFTTTTGTLDFSWFDVAYFSTSVTFSKSTLISGAWMTSQLIISPYHFNYLAAKGAPNSYSTTWSAITDAGRQRIIAPIKVSTSITTSGATGSVFSGELSLVAFPWFSTITPEEEITVAGKTYKLFPDRVATRAFIAQRIA